MVMMNQDNENTAKPALKTVKAIATSPIFAQFDIVKLDGKDVVTGVIGFVDQFGMERMAKTAGEKGVLNLGKHVLAILSGQVDIVEPDEETKAKLAANIQKDVNKAKDEIVSAYEKAAEPPDNVEPFVQEEPKNDKV